MSNTGGGNPTTNPIAPQETFHQHQPLQNSAHRELLQELPEQTDGHLLCNDEGKSGFIGG